jgi:hypothetical protein
MKERWKQEISHSKNFKHGHKLDTAIRKYPNEDQWTYKILIYNIPTLDEAKNLEIICIFYFDTNINGYNMTPGGDGHGKHSKETKNKIGMKNKGKISWRKGKINLPKHSKETIYKMSQIKLNKHTSQKTKNKISKSLTNRKLSKEHIFNRSKSQTGLKRSQETKRKIQIAKLGQHYTKQCG